MHASPAAAVAPAASLAAPAGKTGIEGLAGLDDSRLASVRPIVGEVRQPQAAGSKRRGGEEVSRPSARARTAEEAPSTPDQISAAGSGTELRIPARVNDSMAGNLPLRIASDSTISVKLRDLLSLVDGRMERNKFKNLRDSSVANSFVSFGALRSAGIQLRYEPANNEVLLYVNES